MEKAKKEELLRMLQESKRKIAEHDERVQKIKEGRGKAPARSNRGR